MISRFLTATVFLAALSGCAYNDKVVVEIKTDANGRFASARVLNPSKDKKFNEDAVKAAKRAFPHQAPDAEPNYTYNQPVTITYPLVKTEDEAD